MTTVLETYIPTGNEMVALPTLRQDGSIESINVLSMQYRGLLEIVGAPFLQPFIEDNNQSFRFEELSWNRLHNWIPTFNGEKDYLQYKGTIHAPVGERGFYYELIVKNLSSSTVNVSFGFKGEWNHTNHTINETKKFKGDLQVFPSGWNDSSVMELHTETSKLALAPMYSHSLQIDEWNNRSKNQVEFKFGRNLDLEPNTEKSFIVYWGIGIEEVGAATSAKEMKRQNAKNLLKRSTDWLFTRHLSLVGEDKLEQIMNLNAFFNYFYATGLTFDTEENVLVTSRSPRYYVSAAYWDRDSLLWSFPMILQVDSKRAKEMLTYVFTTQRKNIGVHSRYIDGIVLEPGFELDELCAPIIALYMYIQKTNDYSILNKSYIQDGIELILERLDENKHPEIPLYKTFLQPTDDPIVYPYLTYNNVLVWKAYTILNELSLHSTYLYNQSFEQKANAIKEAIYYHCIFEDEEYGSHFAWSIDCDGNYNVYDEPPGSLQLLAYYGFTSPDDKVYQNTVRLIRSHRYSYAFNGCEFEELGCEHADHPWVLSIANSLLSGRKEQAKDILLRTALDNGIACESINEHTGLPETGEHFATCAGFLAYALYFAFGQEEARLWKVATQALE
ncbi:glycoside hydrolase family 125 protein [Neobacillus terrae]|uniref:glycoside hydrolase family 125 protein n=1 Tax=Neobacillus terrae TaxID=3034837 RepID=UPI0014076F0B|nr:glycoside hydrolase family 125 protein [Neobacillus terrae]NHM33620.1 glycoside hydrolase family 125 protein [Neobacillus terrae]